MSLGWWLWLLFWLLLSLLLFIWSMKCWIIPSLNFTQLHSTPWLRHFETAEISKQIESQVNIYRKSKASKHIRWLHYMQQIRKQTIVESLIEHLHKSTKTGVSHEQSFINTVDTRLCLSFPKASQHFPAPTTQIIWKQTGQRQHSVTVDHEDLCKVLEDWVRVRYAVNKSIQSKGRSEAGPERRRGQWERQRRRERHRNRKQLIRNHSNQSIAL